MAQVDIWSKGEVVRYLQYLLKNENIKNCIHMKLDQGYLDAYYPRCSKDWASRFNANNVAIDVTAYHAPSSYSWPICPKDCPIYSQASNFVKSLIEEDSTESPLTISDHYVHPDRIKELSIIQNANFDLTKLIRMCEELNICYSNGAILAVAMLVRSILDHVPPIFNQASFKGVANNYGGAKSFKGSMLILENSSRKIADSFLHVQIRPKEALPTETQIDFRNDMDVLLQEIVRVLK